jgi:hypothetical protein
LAIDRAPQAPRRAALRKSSNQRHEQEVQPLHSGSWRQRRWTHTLQAALQLVQRLAQAQPALPVLQGRAVQLLHQRLLGLQAAHGRRLLGKAPQQRVHCAAGGGAGAQLLLLQRLLQRLQEVEGRRLGVGLSWPGREAIGPRPGPGCCGRSRAAAATGQGAAGRGQPLARQQHTPASGRLARSGWPARRAAGPLGW